jgi:hypothetical protein
VHGVSTEFLLSSLNIPSHQTMDNTNNKRMRESEPTPEDFIFWGKEIQNKSGCSIGSDAMEDRAFREFFGTTATVVLKIWGKLSQRGTVPKKGTAKHLLWSLYFMRAYPKQSVTCAVVGGSAGAIDPKTHQKFIWPFIEAIADLTSDVVSLLCMLYGRTLHPTSQMIHFFVLDCF